jgi:cyclopropane fatty-acyl-phospholipid synthase-like methyltransferase
MKWIPYPRFLLRKDAIIKILRKEGLQNKTCLEIGYGSGEMLLYFASKGMAVYGFDFSEKAYSTARQRIEENKEKIILIKSLEELTKQKFDYIFSFEVLEHIQDDEAALKSWVTQLKENGKVLISVPSHKNKFGKLDESVGHYRRYDKNDLVQLFENAGLEVMQLWHFGYPLSNIMEYIENQSLKHNNFRQSSKENLSKTSFEGKSNLIIKLISNNVVLFPFHLIQQCFFHKNYGSGIICLAKKK